MQRLRSVGRALPPRLRVYVFTAVAVGVPVVVAAVAAAARAHPSPRAILGIATFLCLTALAEWWPVPIDTERTRLVSLAFVFIISSQLLFGWEWSVLIGTLGIGLVMAVQRCDAIKVLFNSATYAIAASIAALPLLVDHAGARPGYGVLAASVLVGGAAFVFANVLMVCCAIGLATDASIRAVFRDHIRYSGPIFAIAIFVAAQAVILWRLSAPLVFLLGAPLFALTLYQRSSVRSRAAEEAAATDSLTCLKNRRAFEGEGAAMLAASHMEGSRFGLCLIDIDRFKQVNDRHGHLIGDAILKVLAAAIEETAPSCGYRLGGDEFVLLFEPGQDPVDTVLDLQNRFSEAQENLSTLADIATISAGIAFYPEHADDLQSLQKRADMALYQSKYNGRARMTVYMANEHTAGAGGVFSVEHPPVDIRLLTAHRLVALVDAVADAAALERGTLPPIAYSDVLDRWSHFEGNHSRAVADLTVALARRLGVDGKELEDIRIAALMHDVGKIALPDQLLSKPGSLTDSERALVERHPVIGFELLRDLGLAPAAEYVLHHHERWDGRGYPHELAGPAIPFGSRLILVADAFDALTSDRSYRRGVSIDAAIHELQSESGRQFDPLVVTALHEHFAYPAQADEFKFPTEEIQQSWSSSTSLS
jgi:diguanylate cyclase (GGDEF)-like protein/putative nucleotidyltransferase with HDIG domain